MYKYYIFNLDTEAIVDHMDHFDTARQAALETGEDAIILELKYKVVRAKAPLTLVETTDDDL